MRIYDGCPDEETQAWLDAKEAAKNRLTQAGFTVAYFPMEQKWLGFKDYVPVTKFLDTIDQVAEELCK
jgi:hypothetical protein